MAQDVATDAASTEMMSRMSLTAVKRVDPYVKEIVDTAKNVALYSFNRDENNWQKTDIEGALFVYSRSGSPANSIIIINRLNTTNFVEPIVNKLDLQLREPFLLYRNSRWYIYGIWFYDKEECVRIARLLQRFIDEVPSTDAPAPTKSIPINVVGESPSAAPPTANNGNVDLFSMLSKAQEAYQNGTPCPPDMPSNSVLEFFKKASGGNNKGDISMQRLISVEHIEQGVRGPTPGDTTANASDIESAMLESGIAKLGVSPPDKPVTPAAQFLANAQFLSRVQQQQPPTSDAIPRATMVNVPNVQVAPTPLQPPPGLGFLPPQLCQAVPTAVPVIAAAPALMPPTMFAQSSTTLTKTSPAIVSTLSQKDGRVAPEPLTKNQLASSLIFLLKNDTEFVNKIHEGYLKTLNLS